MQRSPTPPHLITLILLTGISVLSLNMFLPSLPAMADAFEVSYATINLSIAGYLAVTAALQLVLGPLSDQFGRRPVMLACLAVFILASLGCVLAGDITTFLAFRCLQGAIIAGAGLSPAIVRDTREAKEAASLLGYIAMAMAVAPMIGPVLGGTLDQLFGWRASFLVFLVLGMGLFALVWFDLGETHLKRDTRGQDRAKAYPSLLRSPAFWSYATTMASSTGTFYAFLAGVPLIAKTWFGMEPSTLGLMLGSITAGFFCGSFISGRFAGSHPLHRMMIAGRLCACAGLLAGLALIGGGWIAPLSLFGATIFAGMGNGITVPSANAGAVSVRPDFAGTASGLAGALSIGTGALITWATGLIVTSANHPATLLVIMLTTVLIGLAASLAALRFGTENAEAA